MGEHPGGKELQGAERLQLGDTRAGGGRQPAHSRAREGGALINRLRRTGAIAPTINRATP